MDIEIQFEETVDGQTEMIKSDKHCLLPNIDGIDIQVIKEEPEDDYLLGSQSLQQDSSTIQHKVIS